MHEIFIERLERIYETQLTQEQRELIYEVLREKKIRKNQFFLEMGSICDNFGFIAKGALIEFTVDKSNKESVTNLYIDQDWSVDRVSLINKIPSKYFIQATEDTNLLLMDEMGYERILAEPAFSRMAVRLLENINYRLRQQLQIAKTSSAAEKLTYLKETHPKYLERFPQKVIASYLGITKETLSRLKNK